MTVKNYYISHFGELTPAKQFHFATRIKNWFQTNEFDEFLAAHEPNHNLGTILENDDYSRVNFYEVRNPYFEKYQGLYALEATLFRMLHLLLEYNVDLREDFLDLYGGKEKLYALCDNLRADDRAFFALTTFAVNVLALTEELFPRGIDVYAEMLEKTLASEQSAMSIYLYTHSMLCESLFYHKKELGHRDLYIRALESCDQIIENTFSDITLDMKFEFLVCAEMVGYEAKSKEKIREEAAINKKDFIRDARKPERLNTFDGSEHRNVLYIMSGLDVE